MSFHLADLHLPWHTKKIASPGLRHRRGYPPMPPVPLDDDTLSRSNADELRAHYRNAQLYVKQLQDALQWGLTLSEEGSSKLEDWNAWEDDSKDLLGLQVPSSDSSVTPVPSNDA